MIRELDQELDHKKTFIDSSRALIAPSDAEIDGYESIGMVFGATMLHVLATSTATEALDYGGSASTAIYEHNNTIATQ